MNTAIRITAPRPLPDASFAMPMRDRYFSPPSPLPLALASSPQKKTLIDLTPKEIEALPLDEFRVLFTATPLRALTREQLTLIDAKKELNGIAGEVLDCKARAKRNRTAPAPAPETKTLIGLTSEQIKALPPEEVRARIAATPVRVLTLEQLALIDVEKKLSKTAHDVLNLLASKKRPVIQVALPRKMETFITQQVEAGYYRDASELVSESLRLLQKHTDLNLLHEELLGRLRRERESGGCV